MGYSDSHKSITRVFDELRQMLNGDQRIVWHKENPRKFAYSLREAIALSVKRAADGRGEPFTTIATLKNKYVIREAPGQVIAEVRGYVPELTAIPRLSEIVVPEAKDALEIVGAAIQHNGKSMKFPNALIDDANMGMIRNWCSKNNYEPIIGEGGALTLRPQATNA